LLLSNLLLLLLPLLEAVVVPLLLPPLRRPLLSLSLKKTSTWATSSVVAMTTIEQIVPRSCAQHIRT